MRRGVRVAVDVGAVRVGVARCDPDGVLATPHATLTRDPAADADIREVGRLAREWEALEVVVGLPRSLSGNEGRAADIARAWAGRLRRFAPGLPVRLVDERLTTVDAHRAMHEAGISTRRSKAIIDQQAAVMILQAALDTERSTGKPAGQLVGERKPRHRQRDRHAERHDA